MPVAEGGSGNIYTSVPSYGGFVAFFEALYTIANRPSEATGVVHDFIVKMAYAGNLKYKGASDEEKGVYRTSSGVTMSPELFEKVSPPSSKALCGRE